jgi:hypothetical protein
MNRSAAGVCLFFKDGIAEIKLALKWPPPSLKNPPAAGSKLGAVASDSSS